MNFVNAYKVATYRGVVIVAPVVSIQIDDFESVRRAWSLHETQTDRL